MTCAQCGEYAENIGTVDAPVLVHREPGACWEGGYHGYKPRGRQPAVIAIERSFKVMDRAGVLRYPWDL